ncbi:MAG: hypothetical protein RI945_35 [Candidatus Parcubacteria bacterium]|jgi:hypothetical protein
MDQREKILKNIKSLSKKEKEARLQVAIKNGWIFESLLLSKYCEVYLHKKDCEKMENKNFQKGFEAGRTKERYVSGSLD